MAVMKCIPGLLTLIAVSAWTKAGVVKRASGDIKGEDETVAEEQLEKARNLNQDSSKIISGSTLSHLYTNPCVLHDNLWPKAADGKVYIPYVIADHYSSQELEIIKKAINSFTYSSCIRFFPRTNQRDFLYIQSLDGCFSCVGRQGYSQTVSLSRQGCIYFGSVQHELLHVLGFQHEHCRSDRDQYIQVLMQNVMDGEDFNFKKIKSLNEETPYDYNSVMHYDRLAYSKDNQSPTMVAVPNPNAVFGLARKMSQSDINRINLLYCST